MTSNSNARILRLTAAIAIATGACSASAVVTLDANFDSGALKSYSLAGNTVNLVGRDTYAFGNHQLGGGHWRWIDFKASGVQGANLTFSISGEFGGDSTGYPPTPANHELKDHEMVYSYDGENWNYFPHANNQLLNIGNPNTNGANDVFKFSLGQPFTQNEVYVAYALPYTYARSVAHAETVLASPWAEPTASGNAQGVIGQAPAGVDELGRSQPALDLFAYRITNPATDSATPKRRAMIATGQHAAETLGIYTYEGLVDWLISDDPRAAAVRDKVEVFCYPTLNASGRQAGLSRAMLQWQNTDSNGYWYPAALAGANDYVDPERKEQRLNGDAMIADEASTPGSVLDLFLDFHSSVPDYTIVGANGQGSVGDGGLRRDDWGYIRSGKENNAWWLALRALQPNLLQQPSGSGVGSKTATGFAQTFLGADMAVTLENQFAISRPMSFYHDYGQNVGLAMYEAWVRVANPLAGDFDEDGDVDANDLTAWRVGAGLTTVAAHWQGDADQDGDADGFDLLVWQQQLGSVTSPAQAVPEPAMGMLLAVGVWGVAFIHSRRLRPRRPRTR